MVEILTLNDATQMPALGFGLYKVPPDQAERVTREGIAAGYRLVDGARFYANEAGMGKAIRDSGLRDELIVTSKFWGDPVMSYDQAIADFTASEQEIGLGPIDIYMIHWPRPGRNAYVDVWRALIELKTEGRVRSIAVSNFNQTEITRLIEETGEVPVLNQIESHPWLPQHELRDFHRAHSIVTQAWSPLGRGGLLEDPVVQEVARKHDATPAQVVIRWHLELGGSAIPKSTHAERLRSNLDVDHFRLDDEDMARIATLNTGRRTGSSPDDRT